MMAEYFSEYCNFISLEIRCVKTAKSFSESYGNSAIGYVQVKIEGNMCKVLGSVALEHKVKST